MKAHQRFGDIVVKNKFQEQLEHLIYKHYKKNDYQDAYESRQELRNMFHSSIQEMIR